MLICMDRPKKKSREDSQIISTEETSPILVGPADLSQGPFIPYHGTIFTAQLPDHFGGKYAALKLMPPGKIFKGYIGNAILGNSDFATEKVFRRMRGGQFGRFIVDDLELDTHHSPTERHWFQARFVRPLYTTIESLRHIPSKDLSGLFVQETTEQALIEPQDTRTMLQQVLTRSNNIRSYSPVSCNDFVWLNWVSLFAADTLSDMYDSLK